MAIANQEAQAPDLTGWECPECGSTARPVVNTVNPGIEWEVICQHCGYEDLAAHYPEDWYSEEAS